MQLFQVIVRQEQENKDSRSCFEVCISLKTNHTQILTKYSFIILCHIHWYFLTRNLYKAHGGEPYQVREHIWGQRHLLKQDYITII